MEMWPDGRFVPDLEADAPSPGPEYERCIFDGEWTRATVLDEPVCWPCYRELGPIVGPAIKSRRQVLGAPTEVQALPAGSAEGVM